MLKWFRCKFVCIAAKVTACYVFKNCGTNSEFWILKNSEILYIIIIFISDKTKGN